MKGKILWIEKGEREREREKAWLGPERRARKMFHDVEYHLQTILSQFATALEFFKLH